MFDRTRKKFGLFLARTIYHRHTMSQTDFSMIFSKARSAVLIIPESLEERKNVTNVLNYMQTKFAGNKLTIIANENMNGIPSHASRSKVVVLKSEQKNFFFLPKKGQIIDVIKSAYDCVIDLGTSLEPETAFMCKAITAPLKVGFVKEYGDIFYNFQINTREQKNARSKYELLIKTLSMF